jgi:general secretion pathway protein G
MKTVITCLACIAIIHSQFASAEIENLYVQPESLKQLKALSIMNGLAADLMNVAGFSGRYPTTKEGLSVLVTPFSDPLPKRWKQTLRSVPKDPWNNDFVYEFSATKNGSFIQITSYGLDGKIGSDDVVVSWSVVTDLVTPEEQSKKSSKQKD